MSINYILKVFKMIFIIISITIFIALFWYCFCDIRLQLNSLMLLDDEYQDNFIAYNNISNDKIEDQFIKMIYFSFTTLSTVGIGDFHPRTNIERLFMVIILLLSIIINSYII